MPELIPAGGLSLTDNGDGTATLDGAGVIPAGVILMWSGSVASIPTGWQLCDGSNGTPDLRDRFLVGAGTTYAPGDTGGEATHQLIANELPTHTHGVEIVTGSAGAHTHTMPAVPTSSLSAGPNAVETNNAATGTLSTSSAGAHTHNVIGVTGSAGADAAHENRPPYYALAFIQKL